jgi:tRNA pseudouridine38-40 synthase
MTERNIKLILEYDGGEFFGWQRQPNRRTVQGALEAAARAVTGETIPVIGAGRTDAGVHATGQVCNFCTVSTLPVCRLRAAIQSNLPEDIAIRGIEKVPADFHSRYSAVERRYVYFVRTEPTALYRRFVHVTRHTLDIDRMRRAARSFLGTHDFYGFAAAMDDERSTICRVRRLEIQQSGLLLSFHIDADRFLRKMVRTVVGTLIEAGRGKIAPERIDEILCTKERKAAGPTLPPQGLFLVAVVYPPGDYV